MLSKVGKWYSEVLLYKGSQWLSILAQIAFLVAITVNIVMVSVRKLFVAFGWTLGGGIIGGYEVTQVAMVFMATCALSYTWYTAGHIRMGLWRDTLKERPKAMWDTVAAVLAALCAAILVWAVFLQARYYAATNSSTRLSEIPYAPFAFIFVIVMAHAFLVFLRSAIGLASKAAGKKFARESYLEDQ